MLSVCQQSSNTKRSHHRFALYETYLPTFQVYTKAFANVDFATEQQSNQRSNLISRTHSTLQIVCCRLLPPLFKSEPVYNLLIAAHTSELDPRLLNHSASRGVRHLIRIADYYVPLPSASSEHTYFHRPQPLCWHYSPSVSLSDIHYEPYALSDINAPRLWDCQTLPRQVIATCQTFLNFPTMGHGIAEIALSRSRLPRGAAACPADRRQVQNGLANCGCRCGNT